MKVCVIYLFLRNKRGALRVHGIVREVVREGFDSFPHWISSDAVWELNKKHKTSSTTCTLRSFVQLVSVFLKSTFRLEMEVLFPSILMMHFAVRSFSLWNINNVHVWMFVRTFHVFLLQCEKQQLVLPETCSQSVNGSCLDHVIKHTVETIWIWHEASYTFKMKNCTFSWQL